MAVLTNSTSHNLLTTTVDAAVLYVGSSTYPGSTVTYNTWVKSENPYVIQRFMAKFDAPLGIYKGIQLAMVNIDHATYPGYLMVYMGTSAGLYYEFGNVVANDGNWHMVTMTWAGGGYHPKLYVDGVEATTYYPSGSAPSDLVYNSAPLWLGGVPYTAAGIPQYADVAIADAQIYSRHLAINEIRTLYTIRGSHAFVPDTVLRTRLLTGTGAWNNRWSKDLSNFRNDLIASGSPIGTPDQLGAPGGAFL